MTTIKYIWNVATLVKEKFVFQTINSKIRNLFNYVRHNVVIISLDLSCLLKRDIYITLKPIFEKKVGQQ